MSAAFLFGIGAAKAGTTWFSQALRRHEQAALPVVKEVHYFDSLDRGTSVNAMTYLIQNREKIRAELAAAKDVSAQDRLFTRLQNIDRWLGLIGSQRRNDAVYERLMLRSAGPQKRVVADITPAYALLKQDTFARMAALNGGNTRFLMILRDPIDRLWSNIAMVAERRAAKPAQRTAITERLVDSVVTNGHDDLRLRCDYASTLSRLEAAVPASQRLTVFFEDLFKPATLARISDFIGLDSPLVGSDKKINSNTDRAIPQQAHARLSDLLRPQYEDIKSRLGVLPQRWQDNLAQSMVIS